MGDRGKGGYSGWAWIIGERVDYLKDRGLPMMVSIIELCLSDCERDGYSAAAWMIRQRVDYSKDRGLSKLI